MYKDWHRGIERKSARELSLMRAAGRVNALALEAAKRAIRPGVTTAVINAAAEAVLRKHGAVSAFLGYPGPYPYPAVTNVCVNEELVHGLPGRRRLKEGDIVSVDVGTKLNGYYADSAFTIGVGSSVSRDARLLLAVTEAAMFAGIEMLRPGGKTGDVSAAIQNYVESYGFHVVKEYTGHGIGRHMHEDPQVPNFGKAARGTELKPGMVVALEPMVLVGTEETEVLADQWTVISKDHSLTAHFEHTVAVTEGEPVILTALDGEDPLRKSAAISGRAFVRQV